MPPGSARVEEIDVLRGLAALCVMVSHYTWYCVKSFQEAPFGLELHTIYGFYAVQLFFIISGFVISLTLEKCRTWHDFAFSRLTRLYPAYWAALSLMVVVDHVVFGKPLWMGGYAANLTMLQEFMGFPNLDGVFWSLTVELAFYAMMAVLLATGLLARIELVAAIWLGLACLWSLAEQYLGIALPAFLPRYLILRHVPFFVAGIMFYRVAVMGRTRPRVALLLAALAAAGLIDGLWDRAIPAVGWIDGFERLGVAALLFTIFGFAVSGRLRFAVSPVTLWLGGISYSLYLCHRNLGFSLLSRLHELGVPVWLAFALTLLMALILAAGLTYLVERPCLWTLRQWYRTRTAAAPAVS
jgi:peptidoglycan/LPS O-acetylase OafA/YrhL